MPDYEVYGLRVRSPVAFPRLPEVRVAGPVDVTLFFGPEAGAPREWERAYVSPELEGELPVVAYDRSAADGAWRLVYGEGVRFTGDRAATRIEVAYDAPLDLDDVLSFLVGPVLGLALRRRGVLALHASAVVIDGLAVGFLGAGGAGKSTLAAALAARGHAVLTDDVLALRRDGARWSAHPGYPEIRLWESSEPLLFGTRGALRPYSANWDKRTLPLDARGYAFAREAVPLGALVLLEEAAADTPTTVVRRGEGAEAIVSLVGNTYVGYLLDADERRTEMRALAELVEAVPIGRLVPAGAGAGPEVLADAVERWVRSGRGVPPG